MMRVGGSSGRVKWVGFFFNSSNAKYLTYVTRLQLVNAVLMSIFSYWCQMFILPKKVLKEINSAYRAYLWHGEAKSTSLGNVGWPNVCIPKKNEGLGIRNLEVWNIVAFGKIAWHISTKQDSLWVKWFHEVYMKECRWTLFNPPVTSN